MIGYTLTATAIVALLVLFLVPRIRASPRLSELRRFVIQLGIVGALFSSAQAWLAISCNRDAASQTILQIERRLALIRTIVKPFALGGWELAIALLILCLLGTWSYTAPTRRFVPGLL